MRQLAECSDLIYEVSDKIQTKVYCVLHGKTVFGNIRMMFITNDFKCDFPCTYSEAI